MKDYSWLAHDINIRYVYMVAQLIAILPAIQIVKE